MNYKLLSGALLSSAVLLAACGGNTDTKTDTKSEDKAETAEKVTTEAPKSNSNELKNDTAVLNDIDVKILKSVFIPKGTYENQTTDQLAITYEVTNKTDKEIDPLNGYFAAFEAYQEDKNSERKLEVGMLPSLKEYDFARDNQLDIIKKGGTVKNAIVYDLEDNKTEVVLKATKGIGGEKLGEKIIKLK